MRRIKIRYKSAQTVHRWDSVPAVIATHEPFYCWNGTATSITRRWLADLELLDGESSTKAEYHNVTHSTFRGTPTQVSSIDEFTGNSGGFDYGSVGHNIDSLSFETLFPQGDLPDAPQGRDDPKLSEDMLPGGVGLAMLDFEDQRMFNPRACASSALRLFSNKVTKLSDLSIVNFILELRELPNIVKRLRELARLEKWWDLTRDDARKYFKNRQLSSDYLTLQFGVCPFIDDILEIMRVLANWRKKLKILLRRTHRIETISAVIHQYASPGSQEYVQYLSYPSATTCDGQPVYINPRSDFYLYRHGRCTPRCCMKYSLLCEDMSKMNVELRGLIDAFGVAWDPVIVWNAIPFSFILDWVWDVAEWLERWAFKARALPVKLRIHDFCVIWKWNGRITVVNEHVRGSNGILDTYTTRFDIPCERFKRFVYEPDYEDLKLAKWDQNVIKKTSLGAALATTAKVAQPPVRQRRFGPSDLTLRNIATELGWFYKRQRNSRNAERLTAKLKRSQWRRRNKSRSDRNADRHVGVVFAGG